MATRHCGVLQRCLDSHSPSLLGVCGRLDLSVPQPIPPAHVLKFNCDPRQDQIGGWLVLKNGFEFWFENGHVRGFTSPTSYAVLQDPALIPNYYGTPRIDRAEALRLARGSLRRLGYDLKPLYADLDPQTVIEPERIGTNVVPYYRFEWEHPLHQTTGVEVEVNAATKIVERLKLWNDSLWRAPPKISVAPPKPRRPPVESARSNGMVRAALDDFSKFAKRMELPVPSPLKMEYVERVEFSGQNGDSTVKLTNGYWLTRDLGRVSGFFAPNSFYKRWFGEPFMSIGEYLGEWKMNEKAAIELARIAIRRAGYADEQFESAKTPEVRKPRQVGPYIIPRYLFEWRVWHPTLSGVTTAEATVEVDAHSKSIKYVHLITSVRAGASPVDRSSQKTNRPPLLRKDNLVPYD